MEDLSQNEVEAIRRIEHQGRLTAQNITQLFGTSALKRPTKSVTTPSAQTTTQCNVPGHQESAASMITQARHDLKLYDSKIYLILCIQLAGGLRISEVLNIRPNDIDGLGNIRINASKGGNSRIVTCLESAEYLLWCRKNSVYPFADYNRFYIYRIYKKYNLMVQPVNSSRKAVTHAIRHIQATAARTANFDNSLISNKLGHKNPNTQKHYGTYKPEGKKQA